jgi:hypothetical protein
MPWTWEIPTGRMFRPDGTLLATGYAGGECGKRPEAVNNLAFCPVKFVGPLPPGGYTMKEWIDATDTGPMSGILVPDPANVMYGRDDFRIHPDLIDRATKPQAASDGCIVLDEPYRAEIKASSDQRLVVVPFFQPTTPTVTSGA